MRIEKPHITIDQETFKGGSPFYNALFLDCEFSIEVLDGAIVFINCYYERCRFNVRLYDIARISIGSFLENCTFREDEAQGVTDAPSSQACIPAKSISG